MPTENDTELDGYINELAGIKDDTATTADTTVVEDDGNDGQAGATGNETQQQATGENQQTQSTDPNASGKQQESNGTQGQQSGKGKKGAEQEQLRPLGDGTFANSRGDIVDQSGKLIAQNGFAARMHQQNRRLKTTLDERTQQLSDISNSVQQYRAFAQSVSSQGLANEDVTQALELAGRLKRGDVIGVAKDVLAIVAAQGYNVTDLLGSEVGDSLELRAVRRMIDERLAPITQQEQARQQQNEAAQRGAEAYRQFVTANDHAELHANEIYQVMQRENVNAQTAYNRLFQFAATNRLDFSQPLGPQITSRMEANKSQQQRGNVQTQQTQQKPMPNGASTRMNGAAPSQPLASADDDWSKIISEVQRTIGNA